MDKKEFLDLESFLFSMIDDFRFLLSPEQWGTLFLDYSKNEILVLLFVSRQRKANVSEIAEYINCPLNTVTGIIGRLEKQQLIQRLRDENDRRVVNIVLTEQGNLLMASGMQTISGYVMEIVSQLTDEEKAAAFGIFNKVLKVFRGKSQTEVQEKRIKRITIE